MHPTHHCCNTPNCTAGAGAACRPTGQRAGAWQVALATRLVALVTPLVALATALAATLAGAQPAAVQINSASNAGSSTPAAGASQVAEARLRIVGSLAGLNPYTKHEAPFWTITLPALTANRVQAEIVPYDRAGIRGQDMLRLIKLGVVPFGTVPLSLSATDDVLIGAPDLAGLNPDLAALRRTAAAFRPVLAQHLRQQHGAELLMVYPYPAQVLFCKTAFSVLADLAGRRVRVSSATQADLVDALGGLPVYTGFADLLPQMRAGALDCAITGTMSGYTVGLAGATSYLHTLAIGWGGVAVCRQQHGLGRAQPGAAPTAASPPAAAGAIALGRCRQRNRRGHCLQQWQQSLRRQRTQHGACGPTRHRRPATPAHAGGQHRAATLAGTLRPGLCPGLERHPGAGGGRPAAP